VETHGSGAAVLVFDPVARRAVLVKQLRVPVGIDFPDDAHVLEVIAGLVDGSDGGAETARREAHEEAGLEIGAVEHVGTTYAAPGISTERSELFLAEVDLATARVTEGGGLADEHEDIEVVELALADLARMADDGRIRDLKTFALIQTLRLKRPELFG
jgi:nudix-type nucleoside diphosphatase (YffH/AdpP family)